MIPDYLLSSYDYELPPEFIAQTPVTPRDNSRLLVVDSPTTHSHSIFRDLPQWLNPNDLLVLNNTRVIPARLYGRKSTGSPVEILLLEEKSPNCWLTLVKPGKKFKIGAEIFFDLPDTEGENMENREISLKAEVIAKDEATGGRLLKFDLPSQTSFWEILEKLGQIPLPPYITTGKSKPEQYQTIYAQHPGAIAAPTAGLHFTEELFQRLEDRGVKRALITLHVGLGTFRPVESEDITNHDIHQEWLSVSQDTIDQIQETKAKGGRIIAVGTTVVRTLKRSPRRIPKI
jgi:S-adenosylmethionine:tRNA ribosyltransferase-isomerase